MANPPPSSDAGAAPLQVVFMGTPALAARVLERLLTEGGHDFTVAGAVTRPDQPRKRGLKLEPSEVGAVAARHDIPTLKPRKIRTAEFQAELAAIAPDLILVVAYGRILPDTILELPRLMPINLHASLLPRHRGAAPIEGAILAGDRESGVTVMRITAEMDAGPILLKRRLELAADETQGSLKTKLAELGATAILDAIAMIRRREIVETPQDESLVTYTKPIAKDDALIDWTGDATQVERMVRAYDPWPVARSRLAGEDLLIWKAAVEPEPASRDSPRAAGTIIELKPTPIVRCSLGSLALLEVQSPGRRRMTAAEYFRGRRVTIGSRFGE
jgi:methionyl-tRNA formyltransferase